LASETARIATLVEVLFQFGPRDGTDAAEADAEEVMVAGVEANTPRIASTEEVMAPGEAAQKKSVIGAHNRCYRCGAISTHGEAKRSLELIGGDKDRQLKHLWEETRIGDILPWDEIEDEAERLLESARANRQASDYSR
jgi:hypothetical protein